MTITNCPMCESSIAENEIVKACTSCGADLSRFIPKPPKIPAVAFPEAPTEQAAESNLGLGIVGALAGAGVGAGLMYGFFLLVGFRFPLLGVGIGYLTGLGAKLLYKGVENTLGMISGGLALLAVVGTLYLMYGEFPILSIISVIVSVSVAYRVASS